ncbi:CzcE family metal-binding protein [Comamonas sp. F1-6]|jgi:hypothetical protein|uniref:CzcE family metal-binding protein n=1 Tax=Comamonas sp. F1-6 TaxID=673550 RepID=UPI0031DF8845
MNTKLAILASIMLSSATASMSASANEGNLTGRSQSTTATSLERTTSAVRDVSRAYGQLGSASQVSLVVDVTRNNQYLNLFCGETVAFTNGKEQFIWKFDGVGHRPVELAKIAPASFGNSTLKIYVSENEIERS